MRTSHRDQRGRESLGSSWDEGDITALVLALLGGCIAYLGRLGAGGSIGIAACIFVIASSLAQRRRRRRVATEMQRLINAGDVEGARLLGERAEKRLRNDPQFRALMRSARPDDTGIEAEAVPEPAGDSAPGPAPGPLPDSSELAPGIPPGSVSPVTSRLAAPVIALLLPALIPGLGAIAALILLILSTRLYRREDPRAWDRRVAALGFITAGLSLLASAAGVSALVMDTLGKGSEPLLEPEITTRMKAVQIAVVILSVIFHEIAHGCAAMISGDPTARDAGRLSFNPVRHLDLFGSVILPVTLSLIPGGVSFGWAKPVPISPPRFRRSRPGIAFVSVAGVGANFALAFACAALLVLTALLISTISPGRQLPELSQLFSPITADWIPGGVLTAVWIEILKAGIIVNLVLASFNLLPFPPLDGSHLLRLILPQRAANVLDKLSAIGMLLLLVLIISNALDYIFLPGLVIAAYLTYLPGMLFSL